MSAPGKGTNIAGCSTTELLPPCGLVGYRTPVRRVSPSSSTCVSHLRRERRCGSSVCTERALRPPLRIPRWALSTVSRFARELLYFLVWNGIPGTVISTTPDLKEGRRLPLPLSHCSISLAPIRRPDRMNGCLGYLSEGCSDVIRGCEVRAWYEVFAEYVLPGSLRRSRRCLHADDVKDHGVEAIRAHLRVPTSLWLIVRRLPSICASGQFFHSMFGGAGAHASISAHPVRTCPHHTASPSLHPVGISSRVDMKDYASHTRTDLMQALLVVGELLAEKKTPRKRKGVSFRRVWHRRYAGIGSPPFSATCRNPQEPFVASPDRDRSSFSDAVP